MTAARASRASVTVALRRQARLLLVPVGLLLGACGNDSPQAMLASAKTYLAEGDLQASSIQLKNALQQDGELAEGRFLLGSIYLQQADLAGAIRELRRAAEQGYPAEQVSPLLARALLRAGAFDELIETFEAARLADRAAQTLVLTAVGDAYLGKGDAHAAAAAYQSAVDAGQAAVGARVGLGRSMLLLGDRDAAWLAAEAALASDAGNAAALALQADVLLSRGQIPEAIDALSAAVERQPDAIAYHYSLISLLLGQQDLEAAVTRLEAMEATAPDHPSTLYLIALTELTRGRLAQAQAAVVALLGAVPDNAAARLLAGSIHLRLDQHAAAQQHLEFVLAHRPGQALARRLLALSLLASKEPGRAREIIEPLLANPAEADPATLTVAGQVMLANGEFDRAAEYFERVTDAAPQDAAARTRLGLSRLATGQTGAAFADLAAAAQLDTSLVQPDVVLVLANLRRGDHDKALEAFAAVERKQPDSPYTHNLKGGLLLAKRDLAGARAAFERALVLSPDFLAAATNLSRLELLEGHPARARAQFKRIIERDPENAGARLLLAGLLSDTGAPPAEVVQTLEHAAEIAPGAIGPRLALARFYLGQGDPAKAAALAQQLVAAHPDDPPVLRLLAQAQSAAGDHQQAAATLGELVRAHPSSGVLLALADALWAVGDVDAAEQAARRALRLQPGLTEAQQRLVGYLVSRQRIDEALAIARDLQRQQPDGAAGFEMEGDARSAAANWPAAASAYRSALDRSGGARAAMKLHWAQLEQGLPDEAERTAADWLRAHPDDLVMLGYLAERALAAGRLEEAAAHYRRMLEQRADQPVVLNNLAWVSGQLRLPDALSLAERAVALSPGVAAILDTLGVLQIDAGLHDEGLTNLQRAAELAPDLPALQLSLAKGYLAVGRTEQARQKLDEILGRLPEGDPLRAEVVRLRQALQG